MSILFSYDFLVVAIAVFFLGVTAAIVGSYSVYRGQSMIGDALGHAAYPGVVLAFMIGRTRNPFWLWIGASCSAMIAYASIWFLARHPKIDRGAAQGLALSGFFGLGMVLKSYIQGHPAFIDASQAGLKTYIFGSAAFLMKDDIRLIACVGVVVLALLFRYRRELIYSSFDPDTSRLLGVPTRGMDFLLLVVTIAVLALGLRAIGAILIASFLIIPTLFASALSKRYIPSLAWAIFCAGSSSLIGTYISSLGRGLSTGPLIILCMGVMTLIALVYARRKSS